MTDPWIRSVWLKCSISYSSALYIYFVGFTLSNSTFNALVQRYSHKDGKVHFDDYIHCIARLKTMFGKNF